jgi:hypothetical protein
MTDLERSLRSLDVDWPATPDVAGRLAPAGRGARSRLLLAAALAVVVAVAAAFAVPQSRSAILRFLHLRGVTVEQVQTLPPAAERPLAAGLGTPIGDAAAARTLGGQFQPAHHGPLYEQNAVVSTLLRGPLLLSEFGASEFLKKFATSQVEWLQVAPGVTGLWIAGEHHVVFFPGASPRLAGNVLVWATSARTYRLEGPALTRAEALRLARAIIGTGTS